MDRVLKTALPLALAGGLALLPQTAFPAEISAERIGAAVDAAFRPVIDAHDIPGLAIAVTVDGQHYFFNYGVASRESGAVVTENTIFELGSVSKTFTATLAAYAAEQGKLSLDDHPSRYMPELAGSALDAANLLNLGTYTAGGLPLQFPSSVDSDAIGAYFQQWTADAAPGVQRRYSNPSIGLLGYIAALALGGDFADLVKSEIIAGLGLEHTHVRVPEEAKGDYAWGYGDANKPIRVNPGAFGDEAYGIKSTAADMIDFVDANIAPNGLQAPLARAVEATQVGYFKVGEMVQGLGWEQYSYPVELDRLLAGNSTPIIMEPNPAQAISPLEGPTLFNKTGSTNGFGAYVAFVPDRQIGIVMLANRNFPIPARIAAAHAVLEALDGEARQ